jgi:hypothetical protein
MTACGSDDDDELEDMTANSIKKNLVGTWVTNYYVGSESWTWKYSFKKNGTGKAFEIEDGDWFDFVWVYDEDSQVLTISEDDDIDGCETESYYIVAFSSKVFTAYSYNSKNQTINYNRLYTFKKS